METDKTSMGMANILAQLVSARLEGVQKTKRELFKNYIHLKDDLMIHLFALEGRKWIQRGIVEEGGRTYHAYSITQEGIVALDEWQNSNPGKPVMEPNPYLQLIKELAYRAARFHNDGGMETEFYHPDRDEDWKRIEGILSELSKLSGGKLGWQLTEWIKQMNDKPLR